MIEQHGYCHLVDAASNGIEPGADTAGVDRLLITVNEWKRENGWKSRPERDWDGRENHWHVETRNKCCPRNGR